MYWCLTLLSFPLTYWLVSQGRFLARGAERESCRHAALCLLSLNVISQRAVAVPLLHVFLQSAVYTERHVADFTFVHVLAHLSVGLHVAGEL